MQPNDPANGQQAPQDQKWTFHKEEEPVYSQTSTESPPAPNVQSHPPSVESEHTSSQPVTWTASEFIDHHKNAGWYVGIILVLAALCAAIFFITKDIISVVAISVVVVLYLVLSAAKPRQRTYTINQQGVAIDQKFYPFHGFKSFAISQEGAIGCVTFMPLKRFMPELSIYFPPDGAEQIIGTLAGCLPHEQRKEHGIDRLAKKLHL